MASIIQAADLRQFISSTVKQDSVAEKILHFFEKRGGAAFKKILGNGGWSSVGLIQDAQLGDVVLKIHNDKIFAPDCLVPYKIGDRLPGEALSLFANKVSGIVPTIGLLLLEKEEAVFVHDFQALEKYRDCYLIGVFSKYIPGAHEMYDEIVEHDGTLETGEIRRYARSLIKSVAELHEMGIIHRDLKVENILVTAGNKEPLLIDFGMSKFYRGAKSHTICGSLDYMAPEIQFTRVYDEKADCFSLGLCLYAMAVGRLPFEKDVSRARMDFTNFRNLPEYLYSRKVQGFHAFRMLDPDLKDLITKLTLPNPKDRLSMADALKEPFIIKFI